MEKTAAKTERCVKHKARHLASAILTQALTPAISLPRIHIVLQWILQWVSREDFRSVLEALKRGWNSAAPIPGLGCGL